jgi:hypothetical protein
VEHIAYWVTEVVAMFMMVYGSFEVGRCILHFFQHFSEASIGIADDFFAWVLRSPRATST